MYRFALFGVCSLFLCGCAASPKPTQWTRLSDGSPVSDAEVAAAKRACNYDAGRKQSRALIDANFNRYKTPSLAERRANIKKAIEISKKIGACIEQQGIVGSS